MRQSEIARRSDNREVIAKDDPEVGAILLERFIVEPRASHAEPQALEDAKLAREAIVDRCVDLAGVPAKPE